jgi:Domain of unknown function (DUF4167)
VNNNFMRSGQHKNNNNQRNRNRNNNNSRRNTGGGGGPSNKVFDSNGPDIKLRGTTQTIAEKYMQLGRDAQSSGDSVAAENYYQHAEHYYRLWAASQPVGHSLQMSRKLGEEEFDENGEEINGDDEAEGGSMDQPGSEAALDNLAPAADSNADQGDGQQQRPFRSNNSNNNNNRDNNSRNFRPRWPNRNNRNYDNRDGNLPAEQGAAPVLEPTAEVIAVLPQPVQAEDNGQWEAPSFLQRPTPVVMDADVPAIEEAAPAVRKPRARKPRVEAENSSPVVDDNSSPSE